MALLCFSIFLEYLESITVPYLIAHRIVKYGPPLQGSPQVDPPELLRFSLLSRHSTPHKL